MIKDCVVGEKWATDIEMTFLNKEFPWYYVDDITHDCGNNNVYGFYHGIFLEGKTLSNTYNLVMPILYQMCDKNSIDIKQIIRVRVGLITRSGVEQYHTPHVDYFFEHKTMLYYVNDSDGETFFFDDAKNITDKVLPEKGKCVLFDGKTLHASSSPIKHNRRIVINYNFV